MLEQLLSTNGGNRTAIGGGPGPTELIAGNADNGFYGEVAASELFTGTEMASLTGATPYGVVINDATPWLKCSLDGKVVYLPKKAIRHGLSFGSIAALGMAYKTDNKRISKNGHMFRVRLPTGAGGNWAYPGEGEDPANCSDSEFNRLVYRLCVHNPPSETPPVLGTYTLGDLGMLITDLGCCFICTGPSTWYIQRNGGGETTNSNSWHSLQLPANGLADKYRGWRPLLELL